VALDIVLAVYVLVALSVMIVGGFDWGFVRATSLTKPIVILLLVLPARIMLRRETWLTRVLRRITNPARRGFGLGREWLASHPAIRDTVFALLVPRLALFAIALVANLLLSPGQARPFVVPFRWQKFVETLAVWDSGWYFGIATRGYYYDPDGQSSVAFFPLYPLLMRVVAWPFGGSEGSVLAAGIAISWIAGAAALVALHRLTERLTQSPEAARRTVLYVAVFPFSFYFSRVYTESLFLLVTVLAVLAAYDSRWRTAGLMAGLATLTRPNGILILIPVALLALSPGASFRQIARRLIALAPAPIALAGYSAYVYRLTGDPLAWLTAQVHWDYSVGNWPWHRLVALISSIEQHGVYDYLVTSEDALLHTVYSVLAMTFIFAVPLVLRRFGPALAAYVVVGLIVPMSGSSLIGIGRYASVLFPVFMAIGAVGSPRLHEAILIVSCLFLTLFLALFVTGHPLV
jgi:hypothetical protein